MSTDEDEFRQEQFLTTPQKFTIYHVVGRKVGCTLHLEVTTKRMQKKGETRPIEVLEKVEGFPSLAADRKIVWAEHFGYPGDLATTE